MERIPDNTVYGTPACSWLLIIQTAMESVDKPFRGALVSREAKTIYHPNQLHQIIAFLGLG